MEGLIPFVYRAIVQYRSGADLGSAVYYAGAGSGGGFIGAADSSSSPSRAGAYVRLSGGGDSGRFRGVQDVMPQVGFGGRPGSSSVPSPSHSGHLQAPLRRSASRTRKA